MITIKKILFLFFPAFFFLVFASSTAYAAAGNAENGRKIYDKRCWWCHGKDGTGEGPAAEFVNPPPRSFADVVYKFQSTQAEVPLDEDLFRVISNGLPGTTMPSWKGMLSEQDRWDLIALIKVFAEGMFEDTEAKPIDYSGEVASSPESIAKGKEIFIKKAQCIECHGDEGRGDGMKAMKDDIFQKRVWPRNLTQPWTFRISNKPKDIYTRVTVGIPGTPMPTFTKGEKKLTNEERWHVANYVNSLADESKKVKPGEKVLKSGLTDKVPTDIADPRWDAANGLVVRLVGQVIAKERNFTPTNYTALLKSYFDKDKIAFLLEWDDRTGSIMGDAVVEKLSEGGQLYQDAIAIQLSQVIPDTLQKPYFGHGDKEMGVNMLYWGAGSVDKRNTVALYDASGHGKKKERPAEKSGFTAVGQYNKGIWKVLMTRNLKTSEETDLQFVEGKFIPFALANWDGSNLEKGSKHTLTTWYWILLEPTVGSEIYTYPAGVAIFLILAQLLYGRMQRKNYT